MSFRDNYKNGVEAYYRRFGDAYKNPHEAKVWGAIGGVLSHLRLDHVLDLACGSGEVTRALISVGVLLRNIEAVDPYTKVAFFKGENLQVSRFRESSFEKIARDGLEGARFSCIICSYALHLCKESVLPDLLYVLSQVSQQLLVISPHKRPRIVSPFWDLQLHERFDGVHTRLFQSKQA